VGAALLLLVVVTGVLVYRKFARAPAPIPTVAPTTTLAARVSPILPTPPPPAPTTGTIHIESQPPGASVTVNGEPKGVTPVDLPDVALGPYQVALELRGYAPASQMVTLTAGATRADVSVPLSRTAPLMGTADLVSNPAGALVQIDGSAAGQTPVTDRRLKVGSHKVDMAKDGYEPWSGTLTVPASRKGRLEAQLKAIPKPVATPTPEVVDANHVYAEGEVDTPPKKVSGRSAEYPSSAPALKRGQRASVTVSFVVTDTGDVSDVQVTESGGPQLDEAVASAFRTWKFTPGVKRGLKVKVKVSRRHTFLGG
jgi:TonB family protein